MSKDIKLMVNPIRHFTNLKQIRDLKGKTFDEVIDIFKERIENWYFLVGDTILNQPNSITLSFGLMTINVIIIDLLSQYEFDKKNSSKGAYENFLKNHIPEFKSKFRNNYKIKYYHPIKKRYIQKNANDCFTDYSQAFYEGFRCGIVHNTMILPFGRINDKPTGIIGEDTWKDDNGENRVDLEINPKKLYNKIKEIFNEYIDKLKNPADPKNKSLIDNFKAKFRRDFGYQIS